MRYVYKVVMHCAHGEIYFSSWLKAFKYCNDQGAIWRTYKDNYITQMSDKKTTTYDICKEQIR